MKTNETVDQRSPSQLHREYDDVLDGGFERWEIDRDPSYMLRDFNQLDHLNPYGFALQALRKNGSVAILDAGCGTGRSLHDLQQGLVATTGFARDKVLAVGLNDRDYSRESELLDVRRDIRQNRLGYVIGKIESMPFGDKTFDVIYSYETLIHTGERASLLIESLADALKTGGALYFNVSPKQDQDGSFQDLLHSLGVTCDIKSYAKQSRNGQQEQIFYRFLK